MKLPSWFYLARAMALLVVGVMLLLHEGFGVGAVRPLVIAAGLLLIGFAPVDLMRFWKGGAMVDGAGG